MTALRGSRPACLAWTLAAVTTALCVGCSSPGGGESNQTRRGSRRDRPVAVRVEEVKTGPLRIALKLVGEVRARREVEIAAPAPGTVVDVLVEMGDAVEEGQLLARLDVAPFRAKLGEARASLNVGRASIRRAEADYGSVSAEVRRKAPLAEDELITAQEMEQLRARQDSSKASIDLARAQAGQAEASIRVIQQQLQDRQLVAPFPGRVQARLLDPGAVVGAGTPVLRLVHTDPAVVRFPVSEQQVGRLRRRLAAGHVDVVLRAPAYPDGQWTGRLVRLSPALDPESRSATAEAEFANPTSDLMPGMFCRLTIDLGGRDAATQVPLLAVVERPSSPDATDAGAGVKVRPNQRSVFVVREGKAKNVAVRLGVEQGDFAEVLDGLSPGARVVVEGQDALRDGQAVTIVGEGSSSTETRR